MIELLQIKGIKRRKDGNFLRGCLPNITASEHSPLFIQRINESGWQKVKKTKGEGGHGKHGHFLFHFSWKSIRWDVGLIVMLSLGRDHSSLSYIQSSFFSLILNLYLSRSIAEYKVLEQIMAHAPSPLSQLPDYNGGAGRIGAAETDAARFSSSFDGKKEPTAQWRGLLH